MPTKDKATTVKLPKDIFDLEVKNFDLIKRSYHAYLANSRSSGANTKTRGLIRGGGRKPWRQKGTGRARVGSSRNPLWRGGGVVFGPTGNENHTISIPKNSKKLAIKQALSLANQSGQIITTSNLPDTKGKTKILAEWLKEKNCERRVIVIVDNVDTDTLRASRNIPFLEVKQANYLNVYQIVNADKIVFTENSLETLKKWLGDTK